MRNNTSGNKGVKKNLTYFDGYNYYYWGVSFRIIYSPFKNEVKETLDTIFLKTPVGFSISLQGAIDDYFSKDKDKSEINNYLVNYVFKKSDGFLNSDTKVN